MGTGLGCPLNLGAYPSTSTSYARTQSSRCGKSKSIIFRKLSPMRSSLQMSLEGKDTNMKSLTTRNFCILQDTFLHILNNVESVRGNKRMRKEQRLYHPKIASRRRLLPRCNSPVLTRLRQEIVEANEKFNASQAH